MFCHCCTANVNSSPTPPTPLLPSRNPLYPPYHLYPSKSSVRDWVYLNANPRRFPAKWKRRFVRFTQVTVDFVFVFVFVFGRIFKQTLLSLVCSIVWALDGTWSPKVMGTFDQFLYSLSLNIMFVINVVTC